MPALPFARSSTPGHLPTEGQGRIINCFPEKAGDGWVYRRSPGLSSFAASGYGVPRGMIDINGTIYAAYQNAVVTISPTGVVTNVGVLPGQDSVTWARNNRADGPDIVAVCSGGGAYIVTSSSVAGYPGDASLPNTVASVSSMDGYFLFTVPDGRMFASGMNDLYVSDSDHTQNALSFATAESSPDALLRGIVYGGIFYAMGAATIEPWRDIGASPWPLARVPSVLPVGLYAPMAVAGYEDGWGHSPIFVAHDATVRALNGYDTQIISTPDVERFIQASIKSSLEASVHTILGHSFWVLSSNIGSWVYDVQTTSWHERISVGTSNRWRASRSIKSNGKWIYGDTLSPNLLEVSNSYVKDVTDPITWTIQSSPLKEFPVRTAIPSLFANFALAASDVASNPQVTISWSHDGGMTFSPSVTRPLTGQPVRVNRLGLSTGQGLQVQFSVSDPVDFSFSGAWVPDPELRKP